MTDRTMEALKECPFCEGEPNLYYNGPIAERHELSLGREADVACYGILCTSCGCTIQEQPTKAEAIAAWNRRAVPPQEGGIAEVEGLARFLEALAGPMEDGYDQKEAARKLRLAAAELSRLSALPRIPEGFTLEGAYVPSGADCSPDSPHCSKLVFIRRARALSDTE